MIWQLPEPSEERPHGLKYRLDYCTADGVTLIRYDYETGKGDHNYVGSVEEPYSFQDLDSLLDDFWRDVDGILEKIQDE